MIIGLLALLQVTGTAPDIELRATIDIQSLKIEQRGNAQLAVHADPDGGSSVRIEAPKAKGAATLRNVHVTVAADARIGADGQATDTQQPR